MAAPGDCKLLNLCEDFAMRSSALTRREWLTTIAATSLLSGSFRELVAKQADASSNEVLELGDQRELFVDGRLVDKLDGLRMKLHRPRSAGAAITYDGPADNRFSFYTTVLKDGDVYRMYYRGHPGTDWTKSVTCYAESSDGKSWVKPELGLIDVNGSRKNNAILPAGEAFHAFVDGRPEVPENERYKANLNAPGGLAGYVSDDGIHWRPAQDGLLLRRTLRNHFDSQNIMFWSEVEQCYVLYARHMVGGKRATARATSDDFLNWSGFTLMTYSDTGTTTPEQHLYTNQTQPYFRAPHIYIALPGRFQAGRRVLTEEQAETLEIHDGGGGVNDIADGVLMSTRAGSTTYDFLHRESFIRPGIGYHNWTSRNNYPACGIIPTGPYEMSLFVHRNYGQKSAWLQRMTLRTDGFVSVHAPYAEGEMTTRPLTFSGRDLVLNYATSAAGVVRVELQEASGKPIPGYAAQDCAPIVGDEIDRPVRWKESGDLSGVAGQPVRLRFVMKDADLYALEFRDPTTAG